VHRIRDLRSVLELRFAVHNFGVRCVQAIGLLQYGGASALCYTRLNATITQSKHTCLFHQWVVCTWSMVPLGPTGLLS